MLLLGRGGEVVIYEKFFIRLHRLEADSEAIIESDTYTSSLKSYKVMHLFIYLVRQGRYSSTDRAYMPEVGLSSFRVYFLLGLCFSKEDPTMSF